METTVSGVVLVTVVALAALPPNPTAHRPLAPHPVATHHPPAIHFDDKLGYKISSVVAKVRNEIQPPVHGPLNFSVMYSKTNEQNVDDTGDKSERTALQKNATHTLKQTSSPHRHHQHHNHNHHTGQQQHHTRHDRGARDSRRKRRRWNKKRYKKRYGGGNRTWSRPGKINPRTRGTPRSGRTNTPRRHSPHPRGGWSSKHQLASLDPRRAKVRRHLVRQHNLLRSQAQPSAADMLAVTWYHTAAEQAQAWAEQCDAHARPDHPSVRWTSRYGACGQNVFISPTKKRWGHVLWEWWAGRHHFQYGGANNASLVTAYTQMAWYNSHQLGCGFAQCSTTGGTSFFRYVCNYCPVGNDPEKLNRPYTAGTTCSLCPGSCKSPCYRRTCHLCTNACHYSDLWLNCRRLNQQWHEWLCNTKTKKGVERFRNCRATCQCVNEIT